MLDEPVHLTEPSPDWVLWASVERPRIARALYIDADAVQHIGSTAIPGLVAKPIVDLLVGLAAYPPTDAQSRALQSLGYADLGDAGVPGRRYFRRRAERSFNVHAVQRDGDHWQSNLALRELLRTDVRARERYAAAKRQAMAASGGTLLAYSEAKAAVMTALVAHALRAQR